MSRPKMRTIKKYSLTLNRGCAHKWRMKEIYKSRNWSPELVTGRYVRVSGKRGAYVFRVFEAATGSMGPGRGGTLREYDTDGSDLPAWLKSKCIETKTTEKWE